MSKRRISHEELPLIALQGWCSAASSGPSERTMIPIEGHGECKRRWAVPQLALEYFEDDYVIFGNPDPKALPERSDRMSNYFELARVVAKRSHDRETQVGMVLVKESGASIVATGYNGFVRKANDAALPTTRPDKYQYMVHAEENLIANCAKHGISMAGCYVVGTLTPCPHCTRLLWQCGIDIIYAEKIHSTFKDTLAMQDVEVKVWEWIGGEWHSHKSHMPEAGPVMIRLLQMGSVRGKMRGLRLTKGDNNEQGDV